MRFHHQKRPSDLQLRVAGGALSVLAIFAFRALFQIKPVFGEAPSPWIFAQAAIGFVSASLGGILLTYGHHIFDEVRVSDRWRTLKLPPRPGLPKKAKSLANVLARRGASMPVEAPMALKRRWHG
jgi:hypothetical protein